MLIITCKFDVETEDADGEPVTKERSLRYYATLAGDGAGRTKALLAKLDPELDMSTLAPSEMGEHFAEMECRFLVTIRRDRENKKIKRNNIAEIEPLEEGDFEDA